MFALGEKDEFGKQKRIEYRGKHLRASRTGGIALRAHVKASGINITGNTKRGVRVSTKIAKGTQIAFQNKNFVLRGRYGRGLHKVNLSKSGVSFSTKNEVGTYNWLKPQYSSFKFGGVQLRGKKAAEAQAGWFLLITLPIMIIKAIIFIAPIVFNATISFFRLIFLLANNLVYSIEGIKEASFAKKSLSKTDRLNLLDEINDNEYELAIMYCIAVWGRGNISEDRKGLPVKIRGKEYDIQQIGEKFDLLSQRFESKKVENNIRAFLITLTKNYAEREDDNRRIELLYELDEQCITDGGKTTLQEILLKDYANTAKLTMDFLIPEIDEI